MSQIAGPSSYELCFFDVLHIMHEDGDLLDVSQVPGDHMICYQLLPAAHTQRWIEDGNNPESYVDKKELAEFMAHLPDEHWFGDFGRLVMQCASPLGPLRC